MFKVTQKAGSFTEDTQYTIHVHLGWFKVYYLLLFNWHFLFFLFFFQYLSSVFLKMVWKFKVKNENLRSNSLGVTLCSKLVKRSVDIFLERGAKQKINWSPKESLILWGFVWCWCLTRIQRACWFANTHTFFTASLLPLYWVCSPRDSSIE